MHAYFTIKELIEFLSSCPLTTICHIKYGKFMVNGLVDWIAYEDVYDGTI